MPRAGTVCRRSLCPAKAQRAGLCLEHYREADRQRGSSTERGYGAAHQRRRRELLQRYLGTACPVCGEVMARAEDVEAGHSVPLAVDPGSTADQLVHASCNPKGTHDFNTGRAARSQPLG